MNLTFQPSLQTSVMLCIIIQTLEDSVAEGPESFTAGILLQPGETDVMEGSPNPATVNIPGTIHIPVTNNMHEATYALLGLTCSVFTCRSFVRPCWIYQLL